MADKQRNEPEQKTNSISYECKRNEVLLDISEARLWQGLSPEKKHDFAKQIAEKEFAAELQIAAEFGRTPEHIEKKIKRFISEYDSLAKKYPL